MIEKFNQYIYKENLFTKKDKILLAISGGADSVAMLNLFVESRYDVAIAHCNFHLREAESDRDELFVNQLSKKYKLPFYKTDFDTTKFAEQNGISIEMAARNLRYEWFEKLRNKLNFDFIATAHHLNDNIETFFINLIRGTGIRGLTGIKPKSSDYIVRPLLFARKTDILFYCSDNNLDFVDDSTNFQATIIRNKLRLEIIPEFEKMNPAFIETMQENFERWKDIESIYTDTVHKTIAACITKTDENIFINIENLKKLNPLKTYLFELLKSYHFNSDTVNDIVSSLNSASGKMFFSQTHRIIKDREKLILSQIKKEDDLSAEFEIQKNDLKIDKPLYIQINDFIKSDNFKIPTNREIACFDADKLVFPLKIRKWKTGDYFYPLGLKGKKKLSDFFNDTKFSIIDKENTWILLSGENIIWIIGKRLDDRYKITKNTKNVFQLIVKND